MSGDQDLKPGEGIKRQDGVTGAERYLTRLCDRTFLSLWSYPGLYRDQGQTATSREGKEVCDLLAVSGTHVVLFSDKDCQFPNTGNLKLDWSRWFRRAVLKSAEQVWGAERWIKGHPGRLFLDRSCTQPFPIELPDFSTARFHRVVVAHDASRRCREVLGGSGSLMIAPDIIGTMHCEGEDIQPFTIGQLDPARGYVHVLDDTSLEVLLRTLDTITDFVSYLTKKEQLVESGRLIWAAGEDDLLGYYLRKLNEEQEHDFVLPKGIAGISVQEGFWAKFLGSPERRSQVEANRVSYQWDRMIERFAGHILAGTGLTYRDATVRDQEGAIRLMARESRLRRRLLAEAVLGLIQKTPHGEPLSRATRIVLPSRPGDPYYVLLLLTGSEGEPHEKYRLGRRNLLGMLCKVVKLKFPDAQDIVGYATEAGVDAGCSEDAMYLDARSWTAADEAEAQSYRDDFGLLKQLDRFEKTFREYPTAGDRGRKWHSRTRRRQPRSMRNSPCPCGSGRKFKQCCLPRQRG